MTTVPDLDLGALTDPYDEHAALRALDAPGPVGPLSLTGASLLVMALLALPAGLLWWIEPWLVLVLVPVWLGWTGFTVREQLRDRARVVERRWRLRRLADDNGLDYRVEVREPQRPGAVFAHGFNRRTCDQVVLTDPRPIVLGRQECAAGPNSGHLSWGFATTPLSGPDVTRLPHLLLASRTEDRLRDPVPGPPDLSVAPVHGPGGEAFRVHAPADVARRLQALLDRSLFQPHVLALLTERVTDVEVVDGHLVVYAQETVGTHPDDWRWVLAVVTTAAEALDRVAP